MSEQQEKLSRWDWQDFLGEGVFNFELVGGPGAQIPEPGRLRCCQLTMSVLAAHAPCAGVAEGHGPAVAVDTLYAFNSGNVERFQTLKAPGANRSGHVGLAVRLRELVHRVSVGLLSTFPFHMLGPGSLCSLTLTLPAFACARESS